MFSWDYSSETMFRHAILLGIFFGCLPSTSLPLPLEAAFQGRCEEGNPCDQICFNLHDNMYECDCRPAYTLHTNGYNCMPSRNISSHSHKSSGSSSIGSGSSSNSGSALSLQQQPADNNPAGINIQIEVDIEPPVDEADNLSSAELERLGLPSHHIHYRAGGGSSGLSAQPEVLAPEDIKVSYTVKDELEEETEEWDGRGKRLPSVAGHMDGRTGQLEHNHQESDDSNPTVHMEEISDQYELDPPRALPDTEPLPQPMPYQRTQATQSQEVRTGETYVGEEEDLDEEYDLDFQMNDHDELETGLNNYPLDDKADSSDSLVNSVDIEAASQDSLKDWIYDVPAFCGLDCGRGKCHSEREGSAWLSRCLCPAGFHGKQCSLLLANLAVPQFSGLSHLALPILQNAYSDLHLSLQFKPTSDTGLLLLTGETDDMTGDYLALVLINGYIELRLDCGTGPGVVRSNSKVVLNQWNQLAVNRHDWGVWIQLNQGHREEGRSQGLFSRITFNQPVYIGGQGQIKNTKSFLGVETGFQGCVKNLEINKKKYNLNPSIMGGDVVSGLDLGACSSSGCWDSECGNGTCRSTGDGVSCDCPLGFGGDRCQDSQHVQIPKFTGGSHLRHHGLGDAALLFLELEVVFKPELDHGLILFNGDSNTAEPFSVGDFIALYLVDGYVEFAINLGDGVTIARSGGKVELDKWQRVSISRMERSVYLYLEGQEGSTTVDPGDQGMATQLSLSHWLWLGGLEDMMGMLPASLAVSSQFHGCIQKIVVNGLSLDLVESAVTGLNIDQCQHPCNQAPCSQTCIPVLDSYSCACPHHQGGLGSHAPCENQAEIEEANPIPGFTGSSYLFFNNADLYQNLIGRTNSMNLRLRLRSGHGIILWIGEEHGVPPQHFLLLGVDQGYLQLWFDVGGGETMLQYNHTKVDDGKWHRIRATRMDQYASLMVDNGPVQTTSAPGNLVQLINAKPGLFLGGVSDENTWARARYNAGMTGCVAELSVGNLVDIDLLSTAERGNNIDTCYRP